MSCTLIWKTNIDCRVRRVSSKDKEPFKKPPTSLAVKTFFLTKSSAALKLSSTRTGSSEEIKTRWKRLADVNKTIRVDTSSRYNLWSRTFHTVAQVAGRRGCAHLLIARHVIWSQFIIAAQVKNNNQILQIHSVERQHLMKR